MEDAARLLPAPPEPESKDEESPPVASEAPSLPAAEPAPPIKALAEPPQPAPAPSTVVTLRPPAAPVVPERPVMVSTCGRPTIRGWAAGSRIPICRGRSASWRTDKARLAEGG